MEQFFAVVMRNAWAIVAAMLAVGGGFALIGISLPAVVLFLLAGLLLMALSSQRAAAQAPPDADPV